MRRGIVENISSALFLIAAITAISAAVIFFGRQGGQETRFVIQSVDIENKTIYVKNTGTEPITGIALFVNGAEFGADFSDINPRETGRALFSTELPAGSNIIRITANGRYSQYVTVNVPQPPANITSFIVYADAGLNLIYINNTGTEPLTDVVFYLNGIKNYTFPGRINPGSIKSVFFRFPNGMSKIRIAANENYSQEMSINVILNIGKDPAVAILSPKNASYNSSFVELKYTVSNETTQCFYELDGASNILAGCANQTLPLAEGPHSMIMWVRNAENRWNASGRVYFTINLHEINDTNITVPYKSMKHIVAYFHMQQSDVEFIASHFDLTVTGFWSGFAESVGKISALNPNITSVGYKSAIDMPTYADDWDDANTMHEDAFIKDAYGRRLMHDEYNTYLMDVGNAGWREHCSSYIKGKLDSYPQFDGVFVDNAFSSFSGWLLTTWHVNISNEPSVVKADGTVTMQNKIITWPYYQDPTIVSINPDGSGVNYYTGGNYSGNNLTLGTPLAPGTQVYVSYGAKTNESVPSEEKITTFHNDMKGMLAAIKTKIGNKKLIINSDDRGDFLDHADGVMDEEFIHASWVKESNFPDIITWKKDIDDMVSVVSGGKLFLAQSGVSNETNPSNESVNKMMLFCYSSYLLGKGETSSFSFVSPLAKRYSNISYFPEWDIDLGYPLGGYYLAAEGSYPQYKIYARDFSKGKVLVNPTYGSHTVSLGETYTTIDGHAVDSIIIGPHEGVLLTR